MQESIIISEIIPTQPKLNYFRLFMISTLVSYFMYGMTETLNTTLTSINLPTIIPVVITPILLNIYGYKNIVNREEYSGLRELIIFASVAYGVLLGDALYLTKTINLIT